MQQLSIRLPFFFFLIVTFFSTICTILLHGGFFFFKCPHLIAVLADALKAYTTHAGCRYTRQDVGLKCFYCRNQKNLMTGVSVWVSAFGTTTLSCRASVNAQICVSDALQSKNDAL